MPRGHGGMVGQGKPAKSSKPRQTKALPRPKFHGKSASVPAQDLDAAVALVTKAGGLTAAESTIASLQSAVDKVKKAQDLIARVG
jgi:hypothetical protein